MKPIILQLPTLIFSIVYLNIASTCQPVIISLYAVMWVAFKNIYIPIITLTCSTSRRIFFIPLAKSSSFILRLVWIMPRLSFAHNYYSPIKLNFHFIIKSFLSKPFTLFFPFLNYSSRYYILLMLSLAIASTSWFYF